MSKCCYDLRYNCIEDNCETCRIAKKIHARRTNSLLKVTIKTSATINSGEIRFGRSVEEKMFKKCSRCGGKLKSKEEQANSTNC